MRRLLLPALMFASVEISAQAVWPDEGVKTWTQRTTEAAITANDLRTRLYQYADDSMMGREAGTYGNVKATDYIAAEFKRLGLLPAGENGTYFQEVPYGRVRYDSTKVQLAVAGTPLVAGTDWHPQAPNTNGLITGTVNLSNVATVFGGRYGDSTMAARVGDVRGKVVVFAAAAPLGNNQAPAPGNFTWAQRAGAAAIMVVGTVNRTTLNSRTAVRAIVNAPTGGAALSEAAAGRIFDRPLAELAPGTAGRPVSGSWTWEYTAPEFPTRGVLGILPGSDPALRGQYVLIGAHNDHVGMVRGDLKPEHDSLRAFNTVLRPQGSNDQVRLGEVTAEQWGRINALIAAARKVRPARADSVNNGADDDGSGTVVLLEIAEQMSRGTRPARSIIFHSHAAEEKGLLGSTYWTNNPTVPLDSIVAAHNMDMLGKGRVTDVKFGGPNSVQMLGSRRISPEYGDMIDSLNAVRSEPMVIDYSWDRTNRLNRFCRSDQVSYVAKGIPTTYFSLGYSRDYHMPTDEPQYINYEQTGRVARFVHDIVLMVANRPTRPAVLPWDQQDPTARCGR
jgi:hypothetical protein